MSGPFIELSKEEHEAMIQRAEAAEQRCHELTDQLNKYSRALNRWRIRAWKAERAVKKAIPLIEPIAEIADRIEQLSYGGPPSPLLSVRGEAAKAHKAFNILKQAQEEQDARKR